MLWRMSCGKKTSSLFWEENREDKGEGQRSLTQHRDRVYDI